MVDTELMWTDLYKAKTAGNNAKKSEILSRLMSDLGVDPSQANGFRSAISLIEKVLRKREAVPRLQEVQLRGIQPGTLLVNPKTGKGTVKVKSIGKDGLVRFEELKGAFEPRWLASPNP